MTHAIPLGVCGGASPPAPSEKHMSQTLIPSQTGVGTLPLDWTLPMDCTLPMDWALPMDYTLPMDVLHSVQELWRMHLLQYFHVT